MHKKEEYVLRKSIGNELVTLLEKHDCVLAGGAITSIFGGNHIKDYDIYFRKEKDLVALKEEFKWKDKNAKNNCYASTTKLLCKTDNAITYSIDNKTFQLICLQELIRLDARDIIDQFDFTVCMGAYVFSSKTFVFGDDFLKHLAQRSLVYNTRSKYPFASLYRAVKYIKKGFRISGIEMLKLGLKCNSVKINNFKDLRRQLMGIDTLFLKDLTDKLGEPEMAEKEYDFEIFLEMMDEHLSKFEEFNMEDNNCMAREKQA